MALSRKYLQGMGLTEEQVNAIIEANEETISGLKAEIEKNRAEAEESGKKLGKLQKEMDAIKKDGEENEGKNPFKVKYDALKEEFEAFKTDIKTKETKSAKEKAYRELLKEAGVSEKRLDAVLRVTDLDKIELEEGKVKDKDAITKSIKDEWSDFIQTDGKQGASTSNPPANTGGKMSKSDILNIKDTAERQAAIAENHELFGI